jgi:hypothetical protein
MAFKNKYFDPQTYYYKVIFICIMMGLDIILNSFTQFLDFGSTNAVLKYRLVGYEKDPGDASFAFISYF